MGGISNIHRGIRTGIDLDEMGLGGLATFLQYRTPKMIVVDEPYVGGLYRVSQLLIVIYVLYTMFAKNQWAESEITIGSFNAWSERGGVPAVVANFDHTVYCGNASYSYAYSASDQMNDPVCLLHGPTELTVKDEAAVFLITMYQEIRQLGWP